MTRPLIDEHGRWVIDDYHRRPPFASFLPGMAGPLGVPLWAFYVSRGQGISSFGVEGKNSPIVEFQPANKAYQSVGWLGFRTFLKFSREHGPIQFHEPFGAFPPDARRSTRMCIGANDFELCEAAADVGVETRVRYFTLPSEPFAALVRKVTFTNTSPATLRGELIDGLPVVVPFGVNNWILKEMSNTAVAWMRVENLPASIPFYRVVASMEDKPEVEGVESGNFYLCFADDPSGERRLAPIVDPAVIFGTNTALSTPDIFLCEPLENLLARPQVTVARLPCGFFGQDFEIAPGQELVVCSVIGHCSDIASINRRADELGRVAYVDAKNAEAIRLADGVMRSVETSTSSRVFDLYVRQTCLDNVLRGGFPLVLPSESEPHVCHLYARRHGDTERDYNAFSIPAQFYSEGNGAYRDANQNRRSDVFLDPGVEDHTVLSFMSLIQADGYNPLELCPATFSLAKEDRRTVLALAGDDPSLEKVLSGLFTPGQVLAALEKMPQPLPFSPTELLTAALRPARQHVQARHQEGYWIDHWTYNLDLIDSFLAVYPDREETFFFSEERLTFFDNAVVVAPREDRYVKVGEEVRQLGSVVVDRQKAALVASRSEWPNLMRACDGRGPIYRTSLIAKLLGLCALKFSTLDPYGMGVEMEAEKPGWDDAMNGLPSQFGSSMSETHELRRLLLLLATLCERFPLAQVRLASEVWTLWRSLSEALAGHTLGKEDTAYWNRVGTLRETYRASTRLGYSGNHELLSMSQLKPILTAFLKRLDAGIGRARELNGGLPPTFFVFQPREWSLLQDTDGAPKRDAVGRPNVRVEAMTARPLPLFLEGVVKSMKLSSSREEARELHRQVKQSSLFDGKLGMYKLNASLLGESQEIGRVRAFTPGWLENESIFLHMHYKYLLALLTAGLASEFWEEARRGLIPFLDPDTYGRSLLENSSFLVSSAHPDASLHGRGFVARLSGATAEFLSMWMLATVGPQPFVLRNGELRLCFRPELPEWLFREDGTLGFTFLGCIPVTYYNPRRENLFSQDGYDVRRIVLSFTDGSVQAFLGPEVGEPWASRVRAREVTKIDLYFE